jgi:hypothetical protein
LSDWEKASKISAHTRNYLAENERVIKQLIGEITCHSQVSGTGRDMIVSHGKPRPR